MPTDREPYDPAQPFNADELLGGFTEEQRTVHAADDPVLGEMAAGAQRVWDAFLAAHADEEGNPPARPTAV